MKTEIFSWLLVLEFALPFFILCVILLAIVYGNHKRNKEAARNLILKIKNNEESEKSAILTFLTEKLAIDVEQAKTSSKKIINERKFLFRNLISGLLDKNVDAIASLENDMSRITRHYHQLQPGNIVPSEIVDESSEDDSEKIDELKQEIKALKHEVHITLTTLNNIFAEFSSMFGEEVPETEMSVDQIITAMESFSGKSSSEEPSEEGEDALLDGLEDEEPDAFAEVENALEEIAAETEAEETAVESTEVREDESEEAEVKEKATKEASAEESLDFSLDDELDDIDSALDELELGSTDDEPSWDDAFEESGDNKE